ncbi:unnamed protein product [Prunus armeniaca]|uniref:Heat shock factor binding protein n=1 Tax=Prunus armeniaca TaxID=36596 RepID=A0A6J5UY40_PRUAR|nr:unnamed protein product [Prunus armeniaca]CAB4312035.1 unnamed protein product [Prunus armeniaca]
MDGHDSEDSKQSTADMSAFVQNLLQQMIPPGVVEMKSILCFLDCDSLDEMGTRINELEHSINDLRTEMGIEGSPSPVQQPKPEAGEVKQQEGSA